MGIHIDPTQVRKGWGKGTSAGDEITDARTSIPLAKGSDLADFQTYLTGIGSDMDGILGVAEQVIDELGEGVESCITTYQNTDGKTSGGFNALDAS